MTENTRPRPIDTNALRQLMQAEIDASLTFKAAKANRFLSIVNRGGKVTEAWQEIAADPQLIELDRAHQEARADRLCAWVELTGTVISIDGEGDE